MISGLILYILFTVNSYADTWQEDNRSEINCYSNILNDPGLNNLSSFAKGFNRFLGVDAFIDQSGSLNDWEKKVLKKHPELAASLIGIRCQAVLLAVTVCGVDLKKDGAQKLVQDDAADALRHFIFAYSIAREKGADIAMQYTTAHEGDPEKWAARELMDLENNETAISIFKENLISGKVVQNDEDLVHLALDTLAKGRLSAITKQPNRCSPGEVFQVRPELLLENITENLALLKNFQSCKFPSLKK